MTEIDNNLVQTIARQVLAAMSAATPAARADIHAPMGICTGDYSKFPELKHLAGVAAPPRKGTQDLTVNNGAEGFSEDAAAANAAARFDPTARTEIAAQRVEEQPAFLSGMITAAQLRNAAGIVRLAKDARLTPMAQDFIKEKRLTVQRDGEAATVPMARAVPLNGAPWYWWIDGVCASVGALTERLKGRMTPGNQANSPEQLQRVIKELAAQVKTRRVAGGILFVASGARAICYANRCASLRAAVATCDQTVEEAIDQLAANVLVVEYPHHGFRSMAAMVEQFINAPRPALAVIDRDLQELRTCG